MYVCLKLIWVLIDWKTTFVLLTDTLPNDMFDTQQDGHCEQIIYHLPMRYESPDHAAHYHILTRH
jgi:hypothetical protein